MALTYAMRRPILGEGVKQITKDVTLEELKAESFNPIDVIATLKHGYGL